METARRPRHRAPTTGWPSAFALAVARWLAWLALLGLAAPVQAAPGLVGRYYNNTSLSGTPALTRVDSKVDFNWDLGSPATGLNSDFLSIRWTGVVRVATTGSYTFRTVSDDGVRLWVNGVKLIENWNDHPAATDTSTAVTLTAGVDYPIVLEYYENFGYTEMRLQWKRPGDAAYAAIPASDGTQGLATGLNALLEYRFEEGYWDGTSGEVKDTSGNAYNGSTAGLSSSEPTTARTSPALPGSTGTCGYAVFNRSLKQYVTVPSAMPNLGAMGSFTVTAWIRTTANNATGQRIFIQDEFGSASSSNGWLFSLGDRGAGKLNFVTRATTSAGTDETTTDSVIANNTWYFVAVGVDGTTKTKFIHVYDSAGTALAQAVTTYTGSSIGNITGTVSIGGETNSAGTEANNNYGFSGNIDEVRVYPGALTAGELATVRGLTNACAGVVASYRFEEAVYNGTAGELKDIADWTGGPYNGRAQGAALPGLATASPARGGSAGTCGYATFPGPTTNGAYFTIAGLPVNTAAGAFNTLSFWLYWNGTDDVTPVSFDLYNLWFRSSTFGFNTGGNDNYGFSSTGLANGWHHVVAVFGNGRVDQNRIYIDGVRKTLTQFTALPTNSAAYASSTLRVGTWSGSLGNSALTGRVDELRVLTYAVTDVEAAALHTETHPCSSLHHLEIRHASGSGLTCTPSTLTITACQDAGCNTAYTGGVSGTLTATGTPTVQWPAGAAFSIGSGSSSTTEELQLTSVGSVVLGMSGLSVSASSGTTCNFGSPSCAFSAVDSGFVFDVPNHAADSAQTVSITAVRKSDTAAVCVPAFASVSKNLTFACSYSNPTTGTLPVRVGGAALNAANNAAAACDAGGRAVSLAFNASGVASTTVQYADVGRMTLNASYSGSGSDAGLTLTGSDVFVAAPSSFTISGVTAAPIRAGSAFSATVTAKNANGATTPNFGRETSAEGVALSFTKRQPTGSTAVSGSFSGSLGAFSGGAATATNLAWTEVGRGDLNVVLASGSYLGTGLTASGSTGSAGAVGRFIPHHFSVALTPACGSFSFAGQPSTATVTALNAVGGVTENYDGSANTSPNFAQTVTLSEPTALGVGALSGNTVAASAFLRGVASASPAYAFSDKQTSPRSLVLRATDTDGVASSTPYEGSLALRSGRLRVANAVGSEKAALQLAVLSEYWSGASWTVNGADSCTTVPAAAVARSNVRDGKGNPTSAWSSTPSAITISAGSGLLTLGAPAPAGPSANGSLDLALNLGSTGTDQSCLATHPASTGANRPWLRSRQGACAATADRDPSARASFGVFAPESRKTVHVREIF